MAHSPLVKRASRAIVTSVLLAGTLASGGALSAASAQQVLICRNLHNDLANFDRRASTLGTGGARTLGTSLEAIVHLPNSTLDTSCSSDMIATGSCHPGNPIAVTSPMAPEWEMDPVRLRLIERMRHYHCEPLEAYATGPFDRPDHVKPVESETIVRAKY